MDAAELRDRVIAVVVEHPLVQLLRALAAHALGWAGGLPLEELVEKQPAQRLRRPRIAREQRALDRFWQIDERENRLVRVREIWRNRCGFRLGEAHSSSSG
jgi:hypothetical protein